MKPAFWSFRAPKLMQTLFRGCNQRLASLFQDLVGQNSVTATSFINFFTYFLPSITPESSDVFKILSELRGKNLHLKTKYCHIISWPRSCSVQYSKLLVDIWILSTVVAATWPGHTQETITEYRLIKEYTAIHWPISFLTFLHPMMDTTLHLSNISSFSSHPDINFRSSYICMTS